MSRGNVIVKTRVPADLLAAIEVQIAKRNHHSAEQPWDMSDWIRVAMREKLAKMIRCRAPRGARRQAKENSPHTKEVDR